MPFRLRLGRPIEKELRRLGLAQLDRAMAQLAPGSDLATGIHDARKCLKRARALVRLARYGVGDEQFKALNSAMRDSARLVAPSRDRLVAHQTLGWLEVQSDEEPGTFSALLAAPVAHASAAGPAPEGGPSAGLHDADNKTTSHSAEGAAAAAVVLIAPTRDAMAAVFKTAIGRAEILQSFGGTYRAAQRLYRRAYAGPEPEPMHEWRKRVQHHWRQLQLLEAVWPALMRARLAEAQAISELIGQHQDLWVLEHVLAAQSHQRGHAKLVKKVAACARAQQVRLRDAARLPGARLMADRRDDLVRLVETYWSAAEAK